MIETVSSVVENPELLRGDFRLRLRVPERIDPIPGQFVMVRPHGEYEPLLRRALVFYRVFPSASFTDVDLVYRTMGRGTTQLSQLRPGDRVDFLGPLGRGFSWEDAAAGGEALLVTGGIGIPAVLTWAEQLRAQGVSVRLFHGERTADRARGMICIDDFCALLGAENVVCATEDGSVGIRGLVTEPVEAYLRTLPMDRPRRIFTCGPHAMMHRVAELGFGHRVTTQVCLEAQMACGFGVCVACVVKTKGQATHPAQYQRVCIEGPVFDAEQVCWV